jgi:hypothetical protein
MKANKNLNRLKKRLDALALLQLREVAAGLHAQLERVKDDLVQAQDNVDFWHDQATNMQMAFDDEDFSTHRCVGINKAGEMLVVNTDIKSS